MMKKEQFKHGYALLIGVGQHNVDSRLSLPVTVNDVAALERTLIDPRLCAYPRDHVRAHVNEAATNSNILQGLAWLKTRANADPEATMLIYFSGHGWVSPDERYFLVSQDTIAGAVADTALPATAFTNVLRDVAAKRLLIVLDCCHAQGMAEVKALAGLDDALAKGLIKSDATMKSITESLAQGEGRAVFSSSKGDEQSYFLKDRSLSIFTKHFVEGLEGAGLPPGAQQVTIGSLMTYLGKTVPETVSELYNASQHPFFKVESTEIPVALVRGGKGVPPGGWAPVERTSGRDREGVRIVKIKNVNTGGGPYFGGKVTAGRDVIVGDKVSIKKR
ncbi:MAG: caspase domain-containing protein [Burkholderiales bacterium]